MDTCTAPYRIPAAAKEGFSDGAAYDKYRATYPAAVVDVFLKKLKVAEGTRAHIVEVGAGTGKFTEQLARRPEGFVISAVEPLASMRAQLADKELGGVRVMDGHAASIPLPDGWADAAVVAQAFHWFATEEALDEIARVMKPMAVLGLIWNVEDYNKPRDWPASTKWEQKLNNLVLELPDDGHPRFRHAKWQNVFTRRLASNPLQALRDGVSGRLPRFSLPLGEDRVPFVVWLDKEALWKRMGTLSQIATLDKQALAELRRRFDDALEGDDVERNESGEVKIHGQTYFAWTDKIGGYY